MSQASLTAGHRVVPTWTQVRQLATGVLIALALLLLARRLAGALTVPLSTTASLACGFALGALVLVAERRSRLAPKSEWESARIAALAAAILLPTASTTALPAKFVWVPVIAATSLLRRREVHERADPHTARPAQEKISRVNQQLTRSTEADGRDVCRGSARAEFTVGQRAASIHLAFCPPFATTPQLEAVVSDAFDATVKVGQVWPYAARLDVKLSTPAAAAHDVLVAFTATSPQ